MKTIRAGFLGILAAALTAAPSPATAELPTHYYYQGEPVALELDTSRIAVRFRSDVSENRRVAVAEAAGLGIASAQHLTFENWATLETAMRSSGPESTNRLIEDLLRSPEVEFVSPVFRGAGEGEIWVTAEVLVKMVKGENGAFLSRSSDLREEDWTYGRVLGARLFHGTMRNGFEVLTRANELAEDPRVAWAEPNLVVSVRGIRVGGDRDLGHLQRDVATDDSPPAPRGLGDPMKDQQWCHDNDGQWYGYDTGFYDFEDSISDLSAVQQVVLGIIDDGVWPHPDLDVVMGGDGTDDLGDGSAQTQYDLNGTRTCALAGGAIPENGIGITGPNQLQCLSVRGYQGQPGNMVVTQATWMVNSIALTSSQTRVTVAPHAWPTPSSAVADAIDEAVDNGNIFICSVGDDEESNIAFPADLSSTIAVTGTDDWTAILLDANTGPGIDVSMPGKNILTTDAPGAVGVPGDYATITGTGGAAALAGAAVGLAAYQEPLLSKATFLATNAFFDAGNQGPDAEHGEGTAQFFMEEIFPDGFESGEPSLDWSPDPYEHDPTVGAWTSRPGAGSLRGAPYSLISYRDVEDSTSNGETILTDLGALPNGDCTNPVTAGGEIYFQSWADNLVSGLNDLNVTWDIFVYYPFSDQLVCLSAPFVAGGATANGSTFDVSATPDGFFVAATTSPQMGLVSGTQAIVGGPALSPGNPNLFSRTSTGQPMNGESARPHLSEDYWIGFDSDCTNYVGDTNGLRDAFITTGSATFIVSVKSDSTASDGHSWLCKTAMNGTVAAFLSDGYLHPSDTSDETDLYVWDNGVVGPPAPFDGDVVDYDMTQDGTRFAVEVEEISPLTGGTVSRIYRWDRLTGLVTLVSRPSVAETGTGRGPTIDDEGDAIGYESDDPILRTDHDGQSDVFVFSKLACTAPPTIVTQPTSVSAMDGDPVSFEVEATGTELYYEWSKDGVPIPLATGKKYTIASASGADVGTYECRVLNYCGEMTSAPATLDLGSTGITVEAGTSSLTPLALDRPSPSPFADATSVRFALPENGPARITVHDVAGRRVATLADGARSSGWHTVRWTGQDDAGRSVASGIYFVKLDTETETRTAKVVRLH